MKKVEANMEYRKIPYVNLPVSRILYGLAISPFASGGDGNALLDAVTAQGINTFDMARGYGKAEEVFGKWMEERQNRSKVVILSKCAHPDATGRKRINEREIREDFEASSRSLRTDYIDIYLLHRDDPEIQAATAVEILNALHAEGKIGAFGGSNWSHLRIEEANEYAYKHSLVPFSVSSPNFGLAEQIQDPWGGGCVTISGPGNRAAQEWYEKNQMPVIAYSSLGRGLLSGKLRSENKAQADQVLDMFAMKGYACDDNFRRLARCEELAERKGCSVAQIAMAWIYSQPLNTFAVVSTHLSERMAQNIQALSIPLSQEELQYLDLRRETLTESDNHCH